jgi:hypothetical protein
MRIVASKNVKNLGGECTPRSAARCSWSVTRRIIVPARVPAGGTMQRSTDRILVTHAGSFEHPETVAQRLVRYAEIVGKENVLAGTDCGLGGRIHPELAWAKLRALADGAALASRRLW